MINDQHGVPTTPDLIAKVTTSAINAIKEEAAWPSGVYHLTPKGQTSWYEITQLLVDIAQKKGMQPSLNTDSIFPIRTSEYPTAAERPLNSLLDCDKLENLLDFQLPASDMENLKF